MRKMNFDITLRTATSIKSRQWYANKLKKINIILQEICTKSERTLLQNYDIGVLITNNKEIKALNKRYRKIDKTTDVLSFNTTKNDCIKNNHLGDIVIAIETAKKQAKRRKVKIEDELCLLLTHGYLHLLGYDHELLRDEKSMFRLQNKVLVKMKYMPYELKE